MQFKQGVSDKSSSTCPSFRTRSAPGCCSPCAPPHGPTTLSALSRLLTWPRKLKHMMRPSAGAVAGPAGGDRVGRRRPHPGRGNAAGRVGRTQSPVGQSVGSSRVGPHGQIHCPFCAQDCRAWPPNACKESVWPRMVARACGVWPTVAHAEAARALLQTEGREACPHWHEVAGGPAAPPNNEAGLGDWRHGWQFHASRTRKLYFRDRVLLRSRLAHFPCRPQTAMPIPGRLCCCACALCRLQIAWAVELVALRRYLRRGGKVDDRPVVCSRPDGIIQPQKVAREKNGQNGLAAGTRNGNK